ncbi:sporulation histidine kinase inhibitor Sda [Virgibacillus halodenitrificans]|uniref:sporulation histidine kinase inhibitor Sda n=1 Tax=Virgibacillus halodenitrificans TaxID=1482 RepID=UPI00045CAB82|nr:sporulation histidine kinase inhibitor Sda [Virgibacillus halodenitrificans]MCG1027077.1 sporulation histidine kinase inhibitor Sda [Virgibacillus halodenitrificans]MCJ0929765.1 sporulation histidine kinase inhibitor Sda [Virgibacillus halodenitrificans]MYL47131.1 sporulation histidine kinase inhibitor Sda [Virgibacillus halodenitrificans]WHX26200.1 sporulation histidine kinase inhibitor Sda [Virgibacillus halodenitrificans]CDQ31356.1 Sporulation inhibitor A [Virgibacillus halodenitrificans
MEFLSDKQLADAYQKAFELNLDKDFLHLLQGEINKRKFDLIKKRNICAEATNK